MTQQATAGKPAQDAAKKPAPKQDYRRKALGFLAKAEHPNTSPAEAEACTAKAAELMTKHNLGKLRLREERGQAPEKIVVETIDLTKDFGTMFAYAIYPLIRSMGAEALLVGEVLTVIATPTLHDTLWTLLATMNINMVNAANQAGDKHEALIKKQNPRWSDNRIGPIVDKYVAAWVVGYGKGLAEKIGKRRKAVIDEAPGNALVLQTEAERIQAKYKELYPNARTGKGLGLQNQDAVEKGRAAGRAADIGDARVTGDAVKALAG